MVASASEQSERDEIFKFLRQNQIILVNIFLLYNKLVDTTYGSLPNTHNIALIWRVKRVITDCERAEKFRILRL